MSELRMLIDLHDRVLQKSRIAFGNRLSAVERGSDNADVAFLQRWHDRLKSLEDETAEEIRELTANEPIIEMACGVKGCGLLTAGRIVALVGDIAACQTVSQLWRFAGYAVLDGQAEKPKKGEKIHFNRRLKVACWVLGGQFLKANSPYRDVYDAAKERYLSRGWTRGHAHNGAMRKMIKTWLAHLWEVWRGLEGLPVRELYSHGYLGHSNYDRPEDFGWPIIGPEK